ncbi:MAG: PTS sugar transporter subunit IIA [Planctomycetota bacterium]
MKLSEIVVERAVVAELGSAERDTVIAEMVDGLVEAGAAPSEHRDELVHRLLAREMKSSTGFGRGVAVPHAKHASIEKIAVAVGLSRGGIEFESLDKQPVYSVFLLLSPEDRPEDHLQAMEVIFKSLSKDAFRRGLRSAGGVEDVTVLLSDADAQHLGG